MGGLVSPYEYGIVGRRILVAGATGVGGNMPQITRPQVSLVVRELLPRRTWTAADLIGWLHETQERNEWAKRSSSKRRAVEQVKPDTS